jgi:nicotinamide-nucleotide amidase
MEAIVELLKQLKFTLAVAESFTCGWFSQQLGSIDGVSTVFKGAVVSYSNESKQKLLSIDPEFIRQKGVISSQMAISMAKQVKNILEVDVSISFTGNAGPTALEQKAVGVWYTSICIQDDCWVYEFVSTKEHRNDIRNEAIEIGKRILEEKLRTILESQLIR